MAPSVKRAKTAFQFYQSDQLSKIRQEIPDMSAAMTELSARWKSLTEHQKQPYLDQEAADRERYEREAEEADALKFAEVEAKREALQIREGEDHASRGARQKMEMVRQDREARRLLREAEMDPEELAERERLKEEKLKEKEARKAQRAAQEQAVKDRHKKLDKQEAHRANQRLEYLLQQSSIFAKLKFGAKGPAEAENPPPIPDSKKKKSSHHRDDHQEEAEEGEEEDNHVFLTKQPSCIQG